MTTVASAPSAPTTELVVHPAAEIFPALTSGADFDQLVADIATNGLQRPIVRNLRGAIIDGRRRALACQLTGTPPTYRLWTGDPWTHVLTANGHRFVGAGHRAMIAAAVSFDTRARLIGTQLRQLCGVSMGSLHRAKTVCRKGTPELQALCAAGVVPLTTGARIAGLPIDAQNRFTEKVKSGAEATKAGPPGWTGQPYPPPGGPAYTKREARYRYVQEPALNLIANSFDGLGIALATANGRLDPAITPEQAAQWRSDLSRQAQSFRQLLALLKERSTQGE